MRTAPTRHCLAPGCEVQLPSWLFVCRDHWNALPREVRDAVNRALADVHALRLRGEAMRRRMDRLVRLLKAAVARL